MIPLLLEVQAITVTNENPNSIKIFEFQGKVLFSRAGLTLTIEKELLKLVFYFIVPNLTY